MALTMKEFKIDQEKLYIIWVALTYLPPNGKTLTSEKRREEGKLIKKFKFITEEVRQPIENERVIISRKIKDGETAKIQLEVHEIELIRGKIDDYPFYQPMAYDIVSETWDWLGTGKDVEKK